MSTNVMGFQLSRKITNIFGILILLTKVPGRPTHWSSAAIWSCHIARSVEVTKVFVSCGMTRKATKMRDKKTTKTKYIIQAMWQSCMINIQ
jgi:hypothetical protein